MAQNSRIPCTRLCTRRYRVERSTVSRITNFGRTSRIHPLAGALDLLASNTDIVYIGDAGLSEHVQEQFASFQKEQTVLLHTEPVDEVFTNIY